jgi:acetyl-CoA carboxylase carboxyl transferase subunit beta
MPFRLLAASNAERVRRGERGATMSSQGGRWFEQRKEFTGRSPRAEDDTPELWTRCPACGAMSFNESLAAQLFVCKECDHHFVMSAVARLMMLTDPGSLEFHDGGLKPTDPLSFVDSKPYPARLKSSQRAVGTNDAFTSASGTLDGLPIEIGAFEFKFMGGSMGSVVGECITRLFERATERRRPAVVVSASGGARMQEGVLSLMQMAKTCAALARLHDEARQPYISVLTHPTTGGVAASFAMLGDVILAEPKAQIGFAGPRVIEQTIGQELPEGFQRSEYLLEHGMVDRIVRRGELRATLSSLLHKLAR